MILDLVYRVHRDCIEDDYAPGPQMNQLVAIPMSSDCLSKGRGESCYSQEGMHFSELDIEVPSYDDLRSWILPDDLIG